MTETTLTVDNSWTEKTAKSKSIEDTFEFYNFSREEVEEELLASSFFLPVDLLDSEGIRISSICVLAAADFRAFIRLLSQNCKKLSHYAECGLNLVQAAKYVGVSCRYNKAGTLHVVSKIWYGAPPFDTALASTDKLQEKRIYRLYKFCGLTNPEITGETHA
jgi:hypothetical protein